MEIKFYQRSELQKPPILYICAFVFIFATAYRLATLFMPQMPLPEYFITEDGYLMLTVSRNLASGLGFSVSEGTIATNGVQPLATIVFSLPYLLCGGDKLIGLMGVVLLSTLISILAFWAIYLFAKRLMLAADEKREWALLVATLWFSGPILLFHTMNALETGLYTLILITTANYFGYLTDQERAFKTSEKIIFGALCGLVFLARNDGAFFVAALFLVRFVQVQATGQLAFWGAVREAVPSGLVSLAFAAPWLIYNYRLFGSIVPISGHAQSLTAEFAANARWAPARLFEHMFPMLPIPRSLESSLSVQVTAGVTLIVFVICFLKFCLRRNATFFAVYAAFLLYAAMIVFYYGWFFGADWFLSRYFAPMAPLLISIAVIIGLQIAGMISNGYKTYMMAFVGGVGLLLCVIGLCYPLLQGTRNQGHFQVVRWVEQNVSRDVWVGAIQTGTLGYWHDRTINLDGKVNPHALRARINDGDVLSYVVNSEIGYLADWYGISSWTKLSKAGFNREFQLIFDDKDNNIAIFKRKNQKK